MSNQSEFTPQNVSEKKRAETAPQIHLEPLMEKEIEEAIALAYKIFPYAHEDVGDPSLMFPASLNQQRYKKELEEKGIRTLRYWILKGGNNNQKIIGFTGLYQNINDPPDVGWLGWYGVAPEERGKGLGDAILTATITKARDAGFTALRLYTSDTPNEDIALKMYRKKGFHEIKSEPIPGSQERMFYLEKTLDQKSPD